MCLRKQFYFFRSHHTQMLLAANTQNKKQELGQATMTSSPRPLALLSATPS